MTTIRVYELAKELSSETRKVTSNDIRDKAKELGIFIENHLSQINETEAAKLRKALKAQIASADGEETRVGRGIVRRRRTGGDGKADGPAESRAESTAAVDADNEAQPRARVIRRRRPEEVAEPADDNIESVEVLAEEPEAGDAPEEEMSPTTLDESDVVETETAAEPEPAAEEVVEIQALESGPAEVDIVADLPVSAPEAVPVPEAVETPAVQEPEAPAESVVEQAPLAVEKPAEVAKVVETAPEADATAQETESGSDDLPEAATPSRPTLRVRKPRTDGFKAVVVSMPETPPEPPKPKVVAPVVVPRLSERKLEQEDKKGYGAKKGKRIIYDRRKEPGGKRFGDAGNTGGPRGRKKRKGRGAIPQDVVPPMEQRKVIRIQETITVSELAAQMFVKSNILIKKLVEQGMFVTVNDTLDFDMAAIVATDLGYEVENVAFNLEDFLGHPESDPDNMQPRPPVVTIMGHVDHGKTSLLDRIQTTDIAAGEAGGITQRIGAYVVQVAKGNVVFIDTPGHEAFTAMRARGAMVTDIVILVVAADDGVMPQTIEAINHAKAANVPIIVAVNKMDKPEADSQRVRRELSEHDLLPEEWGGTTIFVDVSARTGDGISTLLDMLLLQAEILELSADPTIRAKGIIIESRLEKGRGPVATVIVQEGTLQVGDVVVAGQAVGRIRALMDHRGRSVKSVTPSFPAEVLGLDQVPGAGEETCTVKDEKIARTVADYRLKKEREEKAAKQKKPTFEQLLSQAAGTEKRILKVVLKADTQGSVDAIRQGMEQVATEQVGLEVIHEGVGNISESDTNLALASDGLVLGFNVKPDPMAKAFADMHNVQILTFSLIHELIDKTRLLMEGKLDLIEQETYLGRAEIRQVFAISRLGKIAGCMVQDGKIVRSGFVRLIRAGSQIWQGKLASLKRFKDDVREVAQGFECGVNFEGFDDLREGDIIESFEINKVAATLEN